MSALDRAGLRVVLITGDGQDTADRIAHAAGIGEVRADLRPDEKKATIVKLRDAWGGAVAAVGDGIDDAPALAAADVGIALGRSAELALEAGSVTVLRGDLVGVVEALAIARRAVGVMRQNLAAALGYGAGVALTLCVVPLASWAPVVCAAGTTLVMAAIVRNSLRLRRDPET